VSPKRGPIVTYKERGRIFSACMGIGAVAILAVGIYIGVSQGTWLVAIGGIAVGICAYGVFARNEREHRGDP
jgi:hypothetical protein